MMKDIKKTFDKCEKLAFWYFDRIYTISYNETKVCIVKHR